jgi:hypothetical protein
MDGRMYRTYGRTNLPLVFLIQRTSRRLLTVSVAGLALLPEKCGS